MLDYNCPKCSHDMRLDDATLDGVCQCDHCEAVIVMPKSLGSRARRRAVKRPLTAAESGIFERLSGSDLFDHPDESDTDDRPGASSLLKARDRSGSMAADPGDSLTGALASAAHVEESRRPMHLHPVRRNNSGPIVAVVVVGLVIIFGLIVALLATQRDPATEVAQNKSGKPAAGARATAAAGLNAVEPRRSLSLAEYRSAVPDAPNEFLMEMMNKDRSIEEAQAEWAFRLKAQMAKLKDAAGEDPATTAAPTPAPPPTVVPPAPTVVPPAPSDTRRNLTLAEMRAAIPEADDDFLIEQIKRERTIAEAKSAWVLKLKEALMRRSGLVAEADSKPTPAATAAPKPPAPETAPEPTPASPKSDPKPAEPPKVAVAKPVEPPQPVAPSATEIAKLHAEAVRLQNELRQTEAKFRLQQRNQSGGAASSRVEGRYVVVDLPDGKMINGKRVLALAEVQVFSNAINIAPSGKASASSVYEGADPKLAIDNNTSGHMARDRSVAHTKGELTPTWELDLGRSTPIDSVMIWNRTDAAGDRLGGYRVTVLDAKRHPVWQSAVMAAPEISARVAVFNRDALAEKAKMIRAGHPPQDGLVGHWPFDGNAADGSGNRRGGVFKGDPSLAEARIGSGAISFDGKADAVSVTNVAGLPAANSPQSVSLWYLVAKNPDPGNGSQVFVQMQNGPAASAVTVGFRPGGKLAAWKDRGTLLVEGDAPSAGKWHHVAYTFDGATHRLYVDGLEKGVSRAIADKAAPAALTIGAGANGSEAFTGRLDDVTLHNRPLLTQEIAMMVQAKDPVDLPAAQDRIITQAQLDRLREQAEAAKQAWLDARNAANKAKESEPAKPAAPSSS